MKAIVKVNGESIGVFYNITPEETYAEMHQRIFNNIIYTYGICSIDIKFVDFN
jgi:hypothetical protein